MCTMDSTIALCRDFLFLKLGDTVSILCQKNSLPKNMMGGSSWDGQNTGNSWDSSEIRKISTA